jgi:hypothetical protein
MEEIKYHYYLYKIINLINNNIYVGVHKTDNLDDGYFGSGEILRKAIKKHSKENFKKEIVEYFDSIEDMFLAESIIVNADFVKRQDTYNCRVGGCGGSGPVSDATREKLRVANTGKHLSEEHKKKISLSGKGKKHKKRKLSTEHKQKLRENRLGWKHPEEVKQKIKEGNTGKIATQETRDNMSRAHKGYVVTEATKLKISEAQKNQSDETRRKRIESCKGRIQSEETRKMIGESNKGKHNRNHTEEEKNKISESLTGKKYPNRKTGYLHSPESKLKMSESRKEYWAKRKSQLQIQSEAQNESIAL